ncbi:hypothetical protein ACOMHN_022784 [Nucella lapillus]
MAGKKNVSLQEKEKLISIIKEQPAVYNATLPEYKDAQFQENIWLSVAEAMGRDDISGEYTFWQLIIFRDVCFCFHQD